MHHSCLKIFSLGHPISDHLTIENLNLDFVQGKKVALLGLNGAGKSSLIRLLVGETKPHKGEIVYSDDRQQYSPTESELKRKLGFQSDTMLAIAEMTGREYLVLCATLKQVDNTKISSVIEQLSKDWEMENILNQPMFSLSKGNLQKISIAQVFVNDPDWLFFDEPCQSLDPLEQDRFNQMIAQLPDSKFCLFSTHNVHHALEVADEIILFHRAKVAHHFDCKQADDYLLVLRWPNAEILVALTVANVTLYSQNQHVHRIVLTSAEQLNIVRKILDSFSELIEFYLPENEALMPLFRLIASGELDLVDSRELRA